MKNSNDKGEGFKLFLSFVKKEKINIIVQFIFIAVFVFVSSLYRYTYETYIYAVLLCFVFGGIGFIISFGRYKQKYTEIEKVSKDVLLFDDDSDNDYDGIEEYYRDTVKYLLSEVDRLKSESENIRTENIDYYTKWVHQIKTPISVMKLELQQEDTEFNRMLLSELFVAEQYVDMVLCKFRLDSYSNDFIFKEYSLDDIIKKAIRKYSRLFVRKKLKLDYTETNASVLTDEKWLGFIIEQLLSNAVKYTDCGSVIIWFDEDRFLHIKDTGIGIASEDIPRIFEKGFTGYNGRADKKSSGLGLYLVKQAADKLSHKITVSSEIGVGTEFLIDLNVIRLEIE